ncbi:MAG TPA: hypothetical protein VG406_18850 [Isosphaeraceae bacterium]|jgi:hypothetical protein|nr:hypothetical protein [Isosphaeraceae bacterium]
MPRNDRRRIARRARRPGLEPPEGRALLALISWKAPVNGDWDNLANWNSGTVPTFNDVASITFKNITITHSVGTDAVAALGTFAALDVSGGSLTVGGNPNIRNQSTTLTLIFTDPSLVPITDSTRVLAGVGPR